MKSKFNKTLAIEMGDKLRSFRKKLSRAIGGKKINQNVFARMFGQERVSSTACKWETGKTEIPSLLLYAIWKNGNSLDAIFNYGDISAEGAKRARELYKLTIVNAQTAREKARELYKQAIIEAQITGMDQATKERVEKGAVPYVTERAGIAVNDTPGNGEERNPETRSDTKSRRNVR